LELEKVQELLAFERKEVGNAKVATEKQEADICQLESAIIDKEHELQVKVVEVKERELSLDSRLQEVKNLEKAVWVEENKYKAEHQKIVALNEEIRRDRSDLEIVQKELHIENQQIEAEYEHLRKEKELDQQQIEVAWAKVQKAWELEKGKMEEERKKVEDEISGKWQQLEMEKGVATQGVPTQDSRIGK
jgi:hypothetical protein